MAKLGSPRRRKKPRIWASHHTCTRDNATRNSEIRTAILFKALNGTSNRKKRKSKKEKKKKRETKNK